MADYIGFVHKDAGSDYGVSFPDFPGCVTAGRTLEEAGRSAQEALALHVAGMVEDGEPIPAPMSLEEAQSHEFAHGAVSFLVVRAEVPESDTLLARAAKWGGQAAGQAGQLPCGVPSGETVSHVRADFVRSGAGGDSGGGHEWASRETEYLIPCAQ